MAPAASCPALLITAPASGQGVAPGQSPAQASGEPLWRRGSLAASYFHAWFPSCPEAAAGLFGGAR